MEKIIPNKQLDCLDFVCTLVVIVIFCFTFVCIKCQYNILPPFLRKIIMIPTLALKL